VARFDAALGFDAATMNQIASVVYQKVYPALFTGQTTVQREGVNIDVRWDVKAPPTFDFSPIPNGVALVRAHLIAYQPPPGVSRDDVRETLIQSLTGTTFVMKIPDMDLTLSSGGTHGSAKASAVVYVQVVVSDQKVSFVPLKATATTANPLDQWLINAVIVPQALKAAGQLFTGIRIPPLSYSGVTLGTSIVTVASSHILLMSMLAGQGAPDPSGFSPPNVPIFAMLSGTLRQHAADSLSAHFSHNFDKSGHVDVKIATASYRAHGTLRHLHLSVRSDPTTFGFAAEVSGNAHAGVKVGCSDVGINYDLHASPNPRGDAAFSIRGTRLHAQIRHIDNFVLVLKPSGNPVQWLLSAVTYPLTQAVVAAFSPVITQALSGYGFDLVTLPNIPISVQGHTFTIVPSNLSTSDGGGGYLVVRGQVAVR
jgi:hypothetical protein